ncbi:MAG: cytochrome c [bacterium]
MRKNILLTIFLVILFLWSVSLTGSGEGGRLFIQKCGQCHTEEGKAPVFAPAKYASRQWHRFFSRNLHGRKKDISDLITEKELEKIKNYLIQHAADSPKPEAAGLK